MIPISDSPRSRTVPIVNWTLILVNISIFLLELSMPPRALDRFLFTWGAVPARVWGALLGQADPFWLVTLITSQFLHGGWAHILGNMLYLWVFGDNVEDRMGHLRYLVFYLLCGITAGLIQTLVLFGSRVPLIGASGAIAGVLGAYLVLYPGARVTVLAPYFFFGLGFFEVPAAVLLVMWFLLQFVNGIAAITAASPSVGGIGWWAHIGGFVAGYLLVRLFARPQRPRPMLPYDFYDPDRW
jgi:membrane associated rhomboid family serine protease